MDDLLEHQVNAFLAEPDYAVAMRGFLKIVDQRNLEEVKRILSAQSANQAFLPRLRSVQLLGLLSNSTAHDLEIASALSADQSWVVREAVVEAITAIGRKSLDSALKDGCRLLLLTTLISDVHAVVRSRAVFGLKSLGLPFAACAQSLNEALNSERTAVVVRALYACEKIEELAPSYADHIVRLLESSHVKVRLNAVRASANLPTKDAICIIAKRLYDRDARVRTASRQTLQILITKLSGSNLQVIRTLIDVEEPNSAIETLLSFEMSSAEIVSDFMSLRLRRSQWRDSCSDKHGEPALQAKENIWQLGYLVEQLLRDC